MECIIITQPFFKKTIKKFGKWCSFWTLIIGPEAMLKRGNAYANLNSKRLLIISRLKNFKRNGKGFPTDVHGAPRQYATYDCVKINKALQKHSQSGFDNAS